MAHMDVATGVIGLRGLLGSESGVPRTQLLAFGVYLRCFNFDFWFQPRGLTLVSARRMTALLRGVCGVAEMPERGVREGSLGLEEFFLA